MERGGRERSGEGRRGTTFFCARFRSGLRGVAALLSSGSVPLDRTDCFCYCKKDVSTFRSRCEALVDVAADWREPDHPPRERAVAETLEASNRWTEEALDYALNRWMQRLTLEALTDWLESPAPDAPMTIGVLHGSAAPLDGLRDAVAVWTGGHVYLGCLPEASPALLPAFADEVQERAEDIQATFVEEELLFERASAVMAQPDRDGHDAVHEQCDEHDIPEKRRLIRPSRLVVAVLDGHESDDARGGIAEDVLLYEGGGHQRLSILWAPTDLSPDPYLEAMARFRGVFPAHPDTPGALQMQKAFLEARDDPRAFAEGLEFLVSRGAPEIPSPNGHIRWSEYEDLDEVDDWIRNQGEALYAVVAREPLHDQLPASWPLRTPGGLHIPPLDDNEGRKIVDFTRSLG